MSILFRRSQAELDPFRPPTNSASARLWGGAASANETLRIGAVWACLRLRSDLISTLPLDIYRTVEGRSVEVPKSPFFKNPASGWLLNEWMYATQFDLDRFGNVFGLIAARDGVGRPSQIELTSTEDWTIVMSGRTGSWEYQYRGRPVSKAEVWHERQFVVPGLPFGLSPVSHGAWSAGHYLSAQQFALDWFASGASPSGTLRNRRKEVNTDEAAIIKQRFRAATSRRDVFVHGNDWEYSPAAGASSDAKFLDAMKTSVPDICRFYGVPADMIDAETSTNTITYANITQRNLQLLTINIGPAITRREARFTHDLVADPRFVKLNTDAMLRMDPKGKLEVIGTGVKTGIYTHDEGRAFLDLEPLTDAQIAKEHQIAGPKPVPGTQTGVTP